MGPFRLPSGTTSLALSAGLLLVGAAGCNAILGGGYEVVPEDASPGADAHVDSHAPRHDAGDAKGSDAAEGGKEDAACPPLSTLPDKPSFESEVCGGLVCTPASNAELNGNKYCADEAGAFTCTLPPYTPPKDAGGSTDVHVVEAGGSKDGGATDGASDAAPVDAGSGLPKCSALPQLAGGFTYPSTVVYAIGSTAIQPYVAHIAQLFAAGVSSAADGGTTTAATIIYAGAGSCVGVQAAYAPAGSTLPPLNTLATTANYYDPTLDAEGNPIPYTCELDTTNPADLGVSDVFPSSCSSLPFTAPIDPLPSPYYDFFGPVQVMEMLVPASSTATSISYEETGLVWGYGAEADIAPWTDPTFLFRRSASSGTQTMISLAVGLDPRVWVGVSEASSTAVKTALVNVQTSGSTANADKTIGILASDVADGMRQSARPLAFQDKGESCAWLPDSSLKAFDKVNVRDGHYPIWGPSHFITTVNSSFLPQPIVGKIIAALSGTDADVARELDVIALYATSHVIPTCAMHVTRTTDGASYTAYQPPGKSACGCYYDDQVPQDSTSCTPCTGDGDCTKAPGGATSCNIYGLPPKGYCEVPGQ